MSRMIPGIRTAAIFWLALMMVTGLGWSAEPDQLQFDSQVAPLLAERCLECHRGPDAKAGLDLSRRASLIAGGESGAAVSPGDPSDSLLWSRVSRDEMPPEHPLDEAQKAILHDWILQGAPWGAEPLDPFRYTTATRAGYDWWAWQPLQHVTVPHTSPADGAREAIDAFVRQRLAEHGILPSEPADARTLVRRLYFDLWGLPPDPDEVRCFCQNPTDEAYEALVDRLLASPHYGERWGRQWLDVVRFGESDGFERNAPRESAWPYRDWVISALNRDLPYDQFVRLQLAGDHLQPDLEGAAAAGFLVAGLHNTVVGSSQRMQRLARQDELEEIIGTVGQTFLGLTVNCARCHDHKFDPISTGEYYQLIAAIDGVTHGERQLPVSDVAQALGDVRQRITRLEVSIGAIEDQARDRILAERRTNPDAPRPLPPRPYATWTFEDSPRDQQGRLHAELIGGARLEQGSLIVDGSSAFARTAALDKDLGEKTLAAWVVLDNLAQRGGGIISVETSGGEVFDGLVFGEQEAGRWMAGSNGFQRTKSFQGPAETGAVDQPVHLAIVYRADGTIAGYRNGMPYGTPYQTEPVRFRGRIARPLWVAT